MGNGIHPSPRRTGAGQKREYQTLGWYQSRHHRTEKTEALLRESDRRKDEFLAMLGHELRNPLTPISNVAQVLSSSPLKESTLNWATETLIRNVTHITKLVDDLLDVSRITRGLVKIQRERVELVKLLKI